MNHYMFVFKEPFTCKLGTIKEGTELTVLGERLFINGGLMEPWYYDIFKNLIQDDELREKYLRRVPLRYNEV